jgi:uncharacterized membrane protein YbaN (DUF454 family)
MQATLSLDTGRRAALATSGAVCVALGVVGIFVPGLPTTVFLLLASYFFSRSSERLRGWLWGHRVLGPYLEMARERRMPRRAKIVSVTSIWGGIACAAAGGAAQPLIVPALLVAGSVGTAAILSLDGGRGPVTG